MFLLSGKDLWHKDRLQGLKEFVQQKNLNNHFKQLKQWLAKRGYRQDHVDWEIERIKLVEKTVLFQIRSTKGWW